MSMPLPNALADLLDITAAGAALPSLSLLFDRGAPSLADEPAEKSKWIGAFANAFNSVPEDSYGHFVRARRRTMELLETHGVELANASRLVIGLGLPHWTETGLLLDRLTGCPYVPGSSVKGMLRAAAGLVASGELPALRGSSQQFWAARRTEVFGPAADAAEGPARGSVAFFDAYPLRWPTLVREVMTPHFGKYYDAVARDAGLPAPGDWDDPNPVSFLAVESGSPFRFDFLVLQPLRHQHEGDDLEGEIEALLRLAVDWIGIGGKTSSGFGRLKDVADAPAPEPPRHVATPPAKAIDEPPAKPAPVVPRVHKDARLEMFESKITYYKDRKPFAQYTGKAADEKKQKELNDILTALKQRKTVIATITTVPGTGTIRRIADIKDVRIK